MIEQASTILLTALLTPETEQAALTELKMAGRDALPLLRAALSVPSLARRAALHAEVLSLLAQYEDSNAMQALLSMPKDDAVVLACQLAHMRVDEHRDTFVAALTHASTRVRVTALRRLANIQRSAATDAEIDEIAQHDPAPAARMAAIDVMATRGVTGLAAILARVTHDTDDQVRGAAIAAAATIDCEQTYATVAEWLAAAPSALGLAATRSMSRCEGTDVASRARDAASHHLQRALADSRVAIRAEAATSAGSMHWTVLPDWLMDALRHDPVLAVRLSLALAVSHTHRDVAAAHLIGLSVTPRAMVSVQAAAWLARYEHDSRAIGVLRDARQHGDARVKTVALRALGAVRGQLAELVASMNDADMRLRIVAAGAVIAGS